MTKTSKKANAYNITKDALTKAFNITFNGVYSPEVKTFMFDQHFRWSKTNKCFYGWTKDIQSLSNKIRELVFTWRNAEIKTNFIECPLIMADDIQTVHVYQNKRDYIAACKKQPEAIIEKITINELLNDDDPAIAQTVANVVTKEKEASLDAKKDEKIEKVIPTLEELKVKYGIGKPSFDKEGRFYCGSNNNKESWDDVLNKYDPERKHPREVSLGKYIKDIIRKELGITVSSRFRWATHTPELNITIKGTRAEMFKTWEELSKDEKQDYSFNLMRNVFGWIWMNISTLPSNNSIFPVAKRHYESFRLSEHYLKEPYKTAYDFAKAIMDSFQYDHTGSNMGDCDYIDCDYFDFVYIDITDKADADVTNNIYHELTDEMYKLAKICEAEDVRRREEYRAKQTQGAVA